MEKISGLQGMAEQAGRAAEFLQSLANPHRLMILCTLIDGERSAGELGRMLDLRAPTLSQHLSRLRREGLIAQRRAGTTIHYRLAGSDVEPILRELHRLFCQPGPHSGNVTFPGPSGTGDAKTNEDH